MRPTVDYTEFGGSAFTQGMSENDNPYPDDTLAHFRWLEGFVTVEVASLVMSDRAKAQDRLVYLKDVRRWVQQQESGLRRDLPSADDVAQAIGWPCDVWPTNCYAIASKTLESGILDDFQARHGKLFLTYGHYYGDISPESVFGTGRPFARHAWLESPHGHVIDPTRYVFHNTIPSVWAGPIEDYDMSGARIRSLMQPSPPEITNPHPIPLPSDDASLLGVLDQLLSNLSHEIELSREIELSDLRWIANRPVAELGEAAQPILQMLETLNRIELMPVDTRKWISDMSAWRDAQSLEMATPAR